MAMLNELSIECFRGIQNLTINELRRINIVVGDNNCGKTSVMEAIQLLRTGWYLLPNKPIQSGTRIVLTYEDGWIQFLEPIPWMTIYLVRNPTT